jgi:multiple sugar transport system permease protein
MVAAGAEPGPVAPRRAARRAGRAGRVAASACLVAFGAVFLLPMLWLILASVDGRASWSVELPNWTLANFKEAFADNGGALLNSVYISVFATCLATVCATLAAYSLSRRRIPWKGPLLLAVLFLSGIPLSIVIIPVFQIFSSLGWLSLWPAGLFLAVTLLPLEIYLIKNFIDAVPRELEEAAVIERASTWHILRRVVLPLSFPGIAAASIIGFVMAWGSFIVPLVLISSPSEFPASLTIYGYVGASYVRFGEIAAFSVVYSIPVVILYAASSRFLSGGFLLAGGIRG